MASCGQSESDAVAAGSLSPSVIRRASQTLYNKPFAAINLIGVINLGVVLSISSIYIKKRKSFGDSRVSLLLAAGHRQIA